MNSGEQLVSMRKKKLKRGYLSKLQRRAIQMSFLCYIFLDLLGKEKCDIKISISLKLIRIFVYADKVFQVSID